MSNEINDIFYRTQLYPDAQGLFSFKPKTINEIKNDCFVVPDTNALLVPYTTGKDSLEQIGKIYKELADPRRLVVPGQVAREFAEHRVTKLKELYQQISRKKATIGIGNYPLLGSLEAYQKAVNLEKELGGSIRDYNNSINAILEEISNWYWDDPVSKLYSEIFETDVVLDISFNEEEIKKRLDKDTLYKLPPGYKDARKDDGGIGDLLIWQTILEIGKTNKKSVLFVSLDQKPDWWSQSEGRALYPRYELVDEFRRVSGGESFHAIKFSSFLTLFGASEEVVEEIRKEEVQARVEQDFDSPKKRLLLLYSEIMQELKEIIGSLGISDKFKSISIWDGLKLLEERGSFPSSLMGSAQLLIKFRNQVAHGVRTHKGDILAAIESGIAILESIQTIPHAIRVVYYPRVELYADPECTKLRNDVHGVILETTDSAGTSKTYSIYHTTQTHFTKGMRVAWEWDLINKRSWGESWYRDPDTSEIKSAGASLEFIGSSLD